MTTQPRIIRFLQRSDAKATWVYERPPILLVELLCLLAGIWAAPTGEARWLLAVTAPLSLWGTELGRRARSGAARKAEIAEAMGIPAIKLQCERDIEQAAKNQQLVTATAPVVALAGTVASAGGAGLTKAAVVGFVVSVIRWAVIELYGAWRRWYRGHVPVMVTLTAAIRKSPAEEYEDWRPSEGLMAGVLRLAFERYGEERIIARTVDDYLRALVHEYSGGQSDRHPDERAANFARRIVLGPDSALTQQVSPAQLAETAPYQSGDLAKMAEQILQDKDGAA